MISIPRSLLGLLSGIPCLQMGLMGFHARGKLRRISDESDCSCIAIEMVSQSTTNQRLDCPFGKYWDWIITTTWGHKWTGY